jgi:putative redox protein
MKVSLKQNQAVHFTATTASGQTLEIDGSPDVGGQEKGVRPMEIVLIALGGCSAIDVILMLKKMRQDVTDCQIDVSGDRVDEVPAIFSDILIDYTVTGKNLDQEKVARAVSLSVEKYCSVSKMLGKSVNIRYDFSVVED